jgi:TonB family protein
MVEHKRRHKGRGHRLGGLWLTAGCLAALPLLAAAQAASEPAGGDAAALERAKRDADKVFKWIMIHSDKPRKSAAAEPPKAEAKPAAAPATTTAAAAPRAAAKPKVDDSPIVERVTPISASAAPGAAARPAGTAVAALAPRPAPASAALPPQLSASDADLALATASAAAGRTAAPSTDTSELAEDDEEELVLLKQVQPEFPAMVVRQLLKGAVQVRFEVKPDGEVGQTEVVKTSSNRLNSAAMRAVAQWKFQPVKKAQHAIVELAFNVE